MFMGEYNHTIDGKGRVIVPAKFRDALGDGFVVTKGLDGCLFVYPPDAWQAFDNGVATQTLCLAANDLGLGTVVMGLYDIDKASDIIGVPEGQILMALVAVGYPDEKPSVPKKKTVEDLLSYC